MQIFVYQRSNLSPRIQNNSADLRPQGDGSADRTSLVFITGRTRDNTASSQRALLFPDDRMTLGTDVAYLPSSSPAIFWEFRSFFQEIKFFIQIYSNSKKNGFHI